MRVHALFVISRDTIVNKNNAKIYSNSTVHAVKKITRKFCEKYKKLLSKCALYSMNLNFTIHPNILLIYFKTAVHDNFSLLSLSILYRDVTVRIMGLSDSLTMHQVI